MQDQTKKDAAKTERQESGRKLPAVSARLPDGTMVELLYRPQERKTLFVVARDGEAREAESVELPNGRLLVPYSAENNLITHKAILLPSEATEYQAEPVLRALVRGFIHRYVDLPPDFEEVAAHYVCFSWRYDDFPDLPYLRVLGDYGSGKSRFLTTVGSIVYRPIFASGASTVSPLFRILDAVGGTLVLDEGDFRFSDEKAEIVKILNNGNAKGFPVLRTDTTPTGEFNPRAFKVFGPKLISTRHYFDDPALESRCITAHLGQGDVRSDIPLNLPPEFEHQALTIRNQLLMYRLREAGRTDALDIPELRTLEPRIAQVFASLLASVDDENSRVRLLAFARQASINLRNLRSDSIEADVVAAALALRERFSGVVPVKLIAGQLSGNDGGAPLSPRAVGAILRRLGLSPRKRQGNYVLPGEDMERLTKLAKRYNVMPSASTPQVDIGDIGDEEEDGAAVNR
ncbi:MAG: hypothetical protein ABJC13_07640 [Acidobacteriota bacterium]